jgi:3-phosphoshikimate 1-carboxyvinyltransferase
MVPTRDHTERILRLAGIQVSSAGPVVSVTPGVPSAFDLRVPGDFSSAAFFIAAALLVPGSAVTVTGVGLNPTRTEFLRLLERMGARLEVTGSEGDVAHEPSGDILAESGPLEAIDVSPDEVALSIDEVTLLALLATSARGTTTIRGARELRNKESDRISGTVAGLSAMGAKIEETPTGMVIEGPVELRGARVGSRGDHRIAMMLGVAGLAASGETIVEGWEWTQISYPGFGEALSRLRKASQ